jgi:hypothetical protein
MTQPTAYTQATDFSDELDSTQVPGDHGQHLDVEFENLRATIAQILVNMAILQRDDTALGNSIVTPDSLSAATKLLIAGGWVPRGAWITATAYAIGDMVTDSGTAYVCVTAHTSGVLATDIAAGKWSSFYSSTLEVLGALVPAANKGIYYTSGSAAALFDLTALARTLLALSTTLGVRQTLLLDKHGADIASANPLNLDNATGDYVTITGAAGIAGITLAEGVEKTLLFDSTPELIPGASFILPSGSVSLYTTAGDVMRVRGEAAGVVRCTGYMRANGSMVLGQPAFSVHRNSVNQASIGAAQWTKVQFNVRGVRHQFELQHRNVPLSARCRRVLPDQSHGRSRNYYGRESHSGRHLQERFDVAGIRSAGGCRRQRERQRK